MQFTKERLEHELLKLKTQFPADHIGCCGNFYQPKDGRTCIMGQLLINLGARMSCSGMVSTTPLAQSLWDAVYCGVGDQVIVRMGDRMIEMNNRGVPWHVIVDALVPPTAIEVADVESGSIPEKSFKTPKPEVDVVHA